MPEISAGGVGWILELNLVDIKCGFRNLHNSIFPYSNIFFLLSPMMMTMMMRMVMIVIPTYSCYYYRHKSRTTQSRCDKKNIDLQMLSSLTFYCRVRWVLGLNRAFASQNHQFCLNLSNFVKTFHIQINGWSYVLYLIWLFV